jgi:hypothetical protein
MPVLSRWRDEIGEPVAGTADVRQAATTEPASPRPRRKRPRATSAVAASKPPIAPDVGRRLRPFMPTVASAAVNVVNHAGRCLGLRLSSIAPIASIK